MAYPPLVVEAPPITPITGVRLFDVASVIPDAADDRWMLGGITWEPRPARGFSTGAMDACNPADLTNPNYACSAPITQKPFMIWDAYNASTVDHTPDFVDALLNTRWDIQLSAVFASELLSGTASTGQSFKASAHAPSQRAFGSAAVSLAQAIAMLEEDLAHTLYGAKGTIWVSPGLVGDSFQNAGLIRNGDRYYTALGHEVCADAGLVDAPAPTGQAASAVGTEWIYASGPVRYAASDGGLQGNADNEFMDMTRNKIVRWNTGYGILQFDPAPVTAILVNY